MNRRSPMRPFLALILASIVLVVVVRSTFGPRDPGPRGPPRRSDGSDAVSRADEGDPAHEGPAPRPEGLQADGATAAIRGTIRGIDGRPVVQARVVLWRVEEVDPWALASIPRNLRRAAIDLERLRARHVRAVAESRTDGAGRYEVPAAAEDDHVVEAGGGVGVDGRLSACVFSDVIEALEGQSREVDLVIGPGIEISGRVVAVSGSPEARDAPDGARPAPEPVSGATVEATLVARDRYGASSLPLEPGGVVDLLRLERRFQPIRTLSAADGSFLLRVAGDGSYEIRALASGRGAARALGVRAGETDVVLRLEPGWTVDGRVRLPDGVPVAGAEVRVHERVEGGGLAPRPEAGAITGALGEFRLDPIRLSDASLVVRGGGIQSLLVKKVSPEEAAEGPLELVVERGHRIRGTVLRVTGEPFAGLRVTLGSLRPGDSAGVLTDADGHFEADTLRREHYRIRIAPGPPYVSYEETVFPGEEDLGIELEEIPVVARGRVADVATLEPIPRARVFLHAARPDSCESLATTSRDGRFEIRCGEVTDRSLRVTAPEHVASETKILRFDPGRPLDDLEILLRRAAHVEGRVAAADGSPVPGALVYFAEEELGHAFLLHDSFQALPTLTDESGGFRLSLGQTTPEREYAIVARHREFLLSEAARVRVEDPERPVGPVDIVLWRGGRISGTVTSRDGPVQGAWVSAIRDLAPGVPPEDAPALSGVVEGTADSTHRGEFRIRALEPGVYVLEARAEGLARGRSAPFALSEGEETNLEIRLEEGAAIEGRVAGRDGSPVSNAKVVAIAAGSAERGGDSFTDGEGRFRIVDLAPGGSYRLEASSASHATRVIPEVPVGTSDLRIVLEEPAAFRVRVLDASSHSPVEPFSVLLVPDVEDLRPAEGVPWEHGGEGAARASGIPPGPYRLIVEAPGYIPHERAVTLVPGGEAEATAALDSGGRIEGRVLDAGGSPLEDARVFAVRLAEGETSADDARRAALEGKRLPRASTDREGAFRISGLLAGAYRIVAVHPDRPGASSEPVRIAPEREPPSPPVTIVLVEGAVLRGRVLDAAGRPVRGGRVTVRSATERKETEDIGTDGRFTVRGLPPGTFEVRIEARDLPAASIPVEVSEDVPEVEATILLPGVSP